MSPVRCVCVCVGVCVWVCVCVGVCVRAHKQSRACRTFSEAAKSG